MPFMCYDVAAARLTLIVRSVETGLALVWHVPLHSVKCSLWHGSMHFVYSVITCAAVISMVWLRSSMTGSVSAGCGCHQVQPAACKLTENRVVIMQYIS
jgi:hypothetical protein